MRAEDLDDLVQLLVEAKYALEVHEDRAARVALDAALTKARHLLTASVNGELTRTRPASH